MKTGKKINVWIAFLALIVFLCGGFGNTLTALAQYPDEQTVHDALMAMRDNYR